MNGPSVSNAANLTNRTLSDNKAAQIGAKVDFLVSKRQAHDTDIITSAHALRTSHFSSRDNLTKHGN